MRLGGHVGWWARGFVGAAYRHRTLRRAGDPHLHWHVLVANLAQGIDGRWSALDGTRSTTPPGQAVRCSRRRCASSPLRSVSSGAPAHEDTAEIAGIPHTVFREFSRRRERIAEWLEAAGEAGPAVAAVTQRCDSPASRRRRTSRRSRPTGRPGPRRQVGGRSSSSSASPRQSQQRWRRVRDRGRVVASRCPVGDDTAGRVRRVARLAARSPSHGPRGTSPATISPELSRQRYRRRHRWRLSRPPCSEHWGHRRWCHSATTHPC